MRLTEQADFGPYLFLGSRDVTSRIISFPRFSANLNTTLSVLVVILSKTINIKRGMTPDLIKGLTAPPRMNKKTIK